MGYLGKTDLKSLAQNLRRQGLSYREIIQQVSVSKDTISRWCRDIELTKEQEEKLLANKQFGQKKGSIVAAKNKKILKNNSLLLIQKASIKEVGKLSRRDRFLFGLALYAGEGNKTDGKGAFVNSNPELIRFMSNWLREFGKIPKEKLKGALWIHDGLDQNKAKRYWSLISGIPVSQFHKTYVVQGKVNSFKKNIHEYGVFTIRFFDTNFHRQIMGWISACVNAKISHNQF